MPSPGAIPGDAQAVQSEEDNPEVSFTEVSVSEDKTGVSVLREDISAEVRWSRTGLL
jgi:hypothetical protein